MRKIIFLHHPKTAGQSIHSFLIASFGSKNVCPARTNEQLRFMPLTMLRKFRVFSGHFDWDSLASISGNNFVFTILRDPFERILSFYFYLREIGLRGNGNSGVKGADLAAQLTPNEFFWDFPDDDIRDLVLNNFDNFYTFYFAGRRYDMRNEFSEHLKNLDSRIRFVALNLARENLATLDLVVNFNDVSRIPIEFAKFFPECVNETELPHINENRAFSREHRFEKLASLGASPWLFDVLGEFCKLDDQLLLEFCPNVVVE